MASITPQQKLDKMIDTMIEEGLLDQQFRVIQDLDNDQPGFLIDVLTIYCEDSHMRVRELENLVSQPVFDNSKMNSHIYNLLGSSASMGIPTVKCASVTLRELLLKDDKESCKKALEVLATEHLHVKEKIETIIQLKKEIGSTTAKEENGSTTTEEEIGSTTTEEEIGSTTAKEEK